MVRITFPSFHQVILWLTLLLALFPLSPNIYPTLSFKAGHAVLHQFQIFTSNVPKLNLEESLKRFFLFWMLQNKVNPQDSTRAGCDMNLVSFWRSSSLSFLTVLCFCNKHFCFYNNRNPHPMVTAQGSPKHRPKMCIFGVHIQLWVWLSPTISVHIQEKSFLPTTALWNQFHPSAFCWSLLAFTISLSFSSASGAWCRSPFLLTFQDKSSCTCKTSAMSILRTEEGEYTLSHGNHLLLIPIENSFSCC